MTTTHNIAVDAIDALLTPDHPERIEITLPEAPWLAQLAKDILVAKYAHRISNPPANPAQLITPLDIEETLNIINGLKL